MDGSRGGSRTHADKKAWLKLGISAPRAQWLRHFLAGAKGLKKAGEGSERATGAYPTLQSL